MIKQGIIGLVLLCLVGGVVAETPAQWHQRVQPTVDELQVKANKGDAMSMFNLAYMYQKNFHDMNTSRYWANKLIKVAITPAKNGDMKMQIALGYIYSDIIINYKKALYWYQQAAKQHSSIAYNSLGQMYEAGLGAPQDYKKAFDYYQLGAKQNYAASELGLGGLYYSGNGFKQDYKKALYWYGKAAKQKQPTALYMLGQIYYFGDLGIVNKAKGIKLFKQAAYLGNPYAQTRLGLYYMLGKIHKTTKKTETKYFPEAWMWLSLAAAQEDPKAKVYTSFTWKHMTGTQRERARQLRENYTGETLDPTAAPSTDKCTTKWCRDYFKNNSVWAVSKKIA